MSSSSSQCALAIENSNPSSGGGSVSVGLRDASGNIEVLVSDPIAPERRHDDALMRTIDRAMASAARTPKSIDVVAVSCGPGGFTGLRVATTAAKMIAATTGCACASAPSALVALRTHQGRGLGRGERFAVALAGKRDTAWITWIDAKAPVEQQIDAAMQGDVADASLFRRKSNDFQIDTLIADAHIPEAIRDAALQAGVDVVAPGFSADACLALAWSVPIVDPVALAPLYPREPEAVSKWRDLHG